MIARYVRTNATLVSRNRKDAMPSSSVSVESADQERVEGRWEERDDEAKNLPEGNAGQDVPDEGGCEPEDECWDS